MDSLDLSSAPQVFVVDDDAAVRRALTFSLELEGYRVEACASAEELLGLELPADRACLVIDERLPGVSGLTALHELRRRKIALPAALITTHPTAKLAAAARAEDVAIIEKPLIGDGLTGWIRSALRP